MKLVLQRVTRASVRIGGRTVADISKDLLILFGAEKQDIPDKVQYLVDRALTLRIFSGCSGEDEPFMP
jgi:D-aminoacyl-tRNA deacylase